MSPSLSRRHLIGAGGLIALAPVAIDGEHAHAAASTILTGPLYVLATPVRVFDSRTAPASLGGGRLSSGNSVGVPFGFPVAVVSDGQHAPAAVWINVTITDTRGAGYLVLRPSDATGEEPLPATSNINWTTSGQTLANLAVVVAGFETYVQIYAGGAGSTHLAIDLQGYIPQPV